MTWEVESSLYEGYGASICDLTRPRGKQTIAQFREYRDAVLVVEAVEALRATPASPESGPLGLKMQSNPSSLSDITRYREALESVKAWDALQDAFPHDLAMKVSEALSSVVGEGNQEISSSCSNLECDGESAATESPSPSEKGGR